MWMDFGSQGSRLARFLESRTCGLQNCDRSYEAGQIEADSVSAHIRGSKTVMEQVEGAYIQVLGPYN